jgi:DNA mismatch repair protein MutS
MSIHEAGHNIEFLHTLKMGPAQKSYGIYVAQLAGIPTHIIKEAKQNLKRLELNHQPQSQLSLFESLVSSDHSDQSERASTQLIEDLSGLDLNQMTPIAALQYLQDLKIKASGHHP